MGLKSLIPGLSFFLISEVLDILQLSGECLHVRVGAVATDIFIG